MNADSSVTTRDPWLPLLPKTGKGGTNETPLNYQAFEVYRDLTPSERSLLRTAQILGRSTTLMEKWSSQFYWVARAGAWDRRVSEVAAGERLRQVSEKAELWAKRTDDSLEQKYQAYLEAVARGREYMKLSLIERTAELKNGSKVTLRPSRSAKAAADLLHIGFKLRDQAVAEAAPANAQIQEINEYEFVPIAVTDPDSQTQDSVPDPPEPGALP
jgi:hypothetical protein